MLCPIINVAAATPPCEADAPVDVRWAAACGHQRTRMSRWAVPSGLVTIRSVDEMVLIRIEYTWFMYCFSVEAVTRDTWIDVCIRLGFPLTACYYAGRK